MTLNLPLADVIEKFIDKQVVSKGYSNSAEYILPLITLRKNQNQTHCATNVSNY